MPVGKEEDFDAKQDSATLQQKCCIGADTCFPPLHPVLLLLLLYFCLRVSLVLENPYFCNFCILLFDKSLKQADKQKKILSPPHQTHVTVFIGQEGTSKIILINLELILLKIYRLIARPPCRGGSITRAEVTGGPGGGAP